MLPQFTPREGSRSRLDRLAGHAALAIAWERLWPVLAATLTVVALFLVASFLGLWLEVPRWGRIGGVCLFGLLFLAALAPLVRFRIPGRAERLARLDRDSGLPHRPATTLEDRLANGADDLATRLLWDVHRRRTERVATELKVALPSPRLVDRDRYALRGIALVGLFAAAFIAGPQKYARTLAAFDWSTGGALSQGYRLDAWIDPPPYNGKPPVLLNLRDPDSLKAARRERAPAGSTIIVRISEGASVSIETKGALVPVTADTPAAAPTHPSTVRSAGAPDKESRWTLKGDARLVAKRFDTPVAVYDLSAIPDRTPTITLKGEPKSNLRGSFTLAYTIDDDYGVIGAEARFAKPVVAGRPVSGRTLAEPPKMPLQLPAMPGGLGDAQTTTDLSEHPWAGARVTLTLSARDEGGNEGLSDPVEVTLPQRPFTNPVSRALVEQRRNLVLAPDDRYRVLSAIGALMIAPERFGTSAPVYLGLRVIADDLHQARTDAQLLDVAALMWEMAVRLEDGNLSDAERDLRAAQQQLRDAINRGAPDDEIKRLMDQMRAALDKNLNELAQQAQRDQQNGDRQQADPNARAITPRDLQSMLDRMEEMMRNGQMADAQRLMDQLQQMLENLQTARPRGSSDPMAREMNRSLDELDDLTRRQQELRDQTYRQQQRRQGAQRNGNRGQPGQRGQQPGDQGDEEDMADGDQQGQQSLQERQEALRQQLEELERRMKGLGMDPKDGLDDADGAMKDAEGQLGQGEQGPAVGSQGRAIEGLRRGAQALADQMQQQAGTQPGEGPGPGEPNGPMRDGRDRPNADPLGREAHDRRDNPRSAYDPLGVPAAQRAQRVLEELRRRLSDPQRPRDELDYLERLLRPF